MYRDETWENWAAYALAEGKRLREAYISREQEVPPAVLDIVREQTAIYLARADRQEAKLEQAIDAAKGAVSAVSALQNEALPALVQVRRLSRLCTR